MQYLGSTYRKNLLFIWNSNFTGCPAFYLEPYRDWVLLLQSICLCSSVSCLTLSPTTLAKTRKSCIDANTLLPPHASWSRAVARRTSCVGGLPGAGLSQLLLSPSQSSLAEEQPTDSHARFSSILPSSHRCLPPWSQTWQSLPSPSVPGHTWFWSQNFIAGKTHGEYFTSEETEDLIGPPPKKKNKITCSKSHS